MNDVSSTAPRTPTRRSIVAARPTVDELSRRNSLAQDGAPSRQRRVDWVDYAKGWCIILVVMMHATLGVGEAMGREGWLHQFVAWARPFRMPDFFLIAGLFLFRTIDADWRSYLDRKGLHFAYFYVLWAMIQCLLKSGLFKDGDLSAVAASLGYALIQPFGTLWFIYLLPIFFIVTKLLRNASPVIVLAIGAALQTASIHTGWTVIDEFSARFVYFFAGYALSPHVFALAEWVRNHRLFALASLVAWGSINGMAVAHGVAARPGVSLALGFAGAGAVVALSALLAAMRWLAPMRFVGSRSIVVYLAFFFPMAATRVALAKSAIISDVGAVSAIVTAVAVVLPLLLQEAVKDTRLRFLFERPARLTLAATRVRREL